MLLKSKISPEKRTQILFALGPLAWIAALLSSVLERTGTPHLDFIIGFLTGVSIVGNLIFIYVCTRYLREKRKQK